MGSITIKGHLVLFDDDDFDLVAKYSWWLTPQGYACTKINKKTTSMHRLIMNFPDTDCIDHVNRNKLDNRKSNLKPCSDSENQRNRPTLKGKSSRFRGVSARNGKWQVVIRVGGKLTWMGSFLTEEEAGLVAAPFFEDIAP